ncbi:MAG: CPBP family intramembrane metalloprotease [Rhodothermales bacterium]|nr:CPBP family intramembrane metalloprotease [Rhodothermales bacterium]
MLRSLITRRPLGSFVVINYLISWTFLYPCYQAILNAEEGTFPPLALIGLIGAFGPTLAAIIVEGVLKGKQGIRALLRKAGIWRVGWYWYAFVLAAPFALYGVAVWSSVLFGFQLGPSNLRDGFGSVVPFFLLALPFGPMGEELGWRGFMLPRLLQKYDMWRSSLLLGVVWTFWHIAS